MPTDILSSIHSRTTQQDIHETTRQLNSGLGSTLVSLLAGAKSRKAAIGWAKHDGVKPNTEAHRRLLAAHQVWALLVLNYDEYTARNWFIGANPRLDGEAPVDVLRAGRVKDIVNAAKAFSEGDLH